MPEEIIAQTPAASEPAPTDPSGQPVIAPERQALINKYEAMYAEPAAEPVEPAVVAQEPTSADIPAEPAKQPELTTVIQGLVDKIAGLEAQLTPKPAAAVPTPQTDEDWLKLLADGKKSEGEQALIDLITKKIAPRIKQEAIQESNDLNEAKQQVTAFAAKIRHDNADILPMEPYIAMAANVRIQEAQAAGLINSPADYVKVYQTAVNAEIENARKLTQTFRGVGKQEAITRTQVVASAQNIRPNAVNPTRDTTPAAEEPAVDPLQDYFAKRREQQSRNHGLSAPQGR